MTLAVRMTAAQTKMDKAIRERFNVTPNTNENGLTCTSQKPLFKLKRFLEVEPRTSTKRGSSPYMLAQSNVD